MGRDHTIFALQPGYVKYYKDPELNPKRQYIGVVLKRDDVLPLPRNAVRRRRLGMELVPIPPKEVELESGPPVHTAQNPLMPPKKLAPGVTREPPLTLRPGYMYRQSNWAIGRAAERANIKVKDFVPGDRWTAWRKSTIRRKRNQESRGLGKLGKLGKKKK